MNIASKYIKQISIGIIVFAIVGGLISIMIPSQYESNASFLTFSSESFDIYKINNSSSPQDETFGGKEELAQVLTILKSKSFRTQIINELNLIEHYNLVPAGSSLPFALKKFDSNFKIKYSKDDGLISFRVFDDSINTSYEISKTVLTNLENSLLSEIKEKNKRILSSIESNLNKKRRVYDSLSECLRNLRTEYKILNSKTQSDYLVKNMLYSSNRSNSDVDKYIKGIDEVKMLESILENEGELFTKEQNEYLNLKNSLNSPLKTLLVVEEPIMPDGPSKISGSLIILVFSFIGFLVMVTYYVIISRNEL
ncbi:MAG: hypothetical protein K2Q22_10270 [Cytophagales bacterium]|nr:hypothetical protein [Cytophagales bacterium]